MQLRVLVIASSLQVPICGFIDVGSFLEACKLPDDIYDIREAHTRIYTPTAHSSARFVPPITKREDECHNSAIKAKLIFIVYF